MCRYQQLHYTEDAYVIRCEECGHFQMLFQKTILSLPAAAFARLIGIVQQFRELPADPHGGDTVLPLPAHGVHLVLSPAALENLASMLEAADAECKALELLQLFK